MCGLALHLVLWAIGRVPHWSYAGLIFGSVTTISLLIVIGVSSLQPTVVFMLFVALSLLSYIIYPVANKVLGASPEFGSLSTLHED